MMPTTRPAKPSERRRVAKQAAYVVTQGEYSDYQIVEVFLDEEQAELFVERHNKVYRGDARVETYDVSSSVDEIVPKLEARYPAQVDYREVTEPSYHEGWIWAKQAKPITRAWSYPWGVWVEGCDFERVKKAFSDRLAQWMVEGEQREKRR